MSNYHKFLDAKSEVASLIRSYDWSNSPLGDPATWPTPLRTLTSFVLNSRFPMFLAWGDEMACLYNDAYAEILGSKHPAALGQRFKEIWFEIWDEIHPFVEQAMAGEAVYHENLPLLVQRREYEEQTYFTFTYSPVHDELGEIKGMCVTCVETTAQVLNERHRKQENERLHAMFQQAPGFMVALRNPNHVIELANDAYLKLIGYRKILGKPLREALPEVAGQGFFELLDHVYASGEAHVGRGLSVRIQQTPNAPLEERFIDFVYQPIKNEHGNVTGIFCEGSDVTEGVRMTNALRESEQRLRQLANTIPHLTWMARPDGYVHWYNDRWYEFTGATFDQVKGWAWDSLFCAEDTVMMRERWQRSIISGEPYEVTAKMQGVTGEWRTFSIRAAPLRDTAGNIVQWFGTNTDVTDLRDAQDELTAANQRKDEFLAMLAHELRNPLAPISAAAALLKFSGDDRQKTLKASEVITRQVRHMTELVDDLLDVSRVTRGLIQLEIQTIDLKTVVASAIEQARPLIEARGHVLTTRMSAEHILVQGDRTRLTQVVANLLANSAKYTPRGGEIHLQLIPQGTDVEIVVQDNGVGIEEKLLPHIFELFTQGQRTPDRSQGGLGIGLALVKSVVALHGGSVNAFSQGAKKGSSFVVTLPRHSHSLLAQEEVAEISQESMPTLCIQIVDDNTDAAQLLAALLELKGHKVSIKGDGESALADESTLHYDVYILDIGLPDINGYDLVKKLRERQSSRKSFFIALTGYGQANDRALSKAAGFDHHFVKPVDMVHLEKLLAHVRAAY